MSQTTINFTATGGDPTQISSVVLSEPVAAAFGIQRTDTLATVVAAGTPFVQDSPGVYHYTFTDPDLSLVYNAWVKVVYRGVTYWQQIIKGEATPHYVGRIDMEKLFGTANIATWADKDGDGDVTKIAANIDNAQTLADRRIVIRASQLRAPIPAITSPLYPGLQDYEVTAAGILLYQGRGEPTGGSRGPDGAGPWTEMLKNAEDQLTGLLIASREQSGVQGTYEAGPVPIASGSNRTPADNLPAQPFGWRFGWNGYGRWPW